MGNIAGLIMAFCSVLLPLVLLLTIRRLLKKEKSFFTPLESDLSAILANPLEIPKYLSNDGTFDFDDANSDLHKEKFYKIPIYFAAAPIYMTIKDSIV